MRRQFLSFLIVVFVFAADRLTKMLVIKNLWHSRVELTRFVSLSYVENTGIAFGIFRNMNLFFIVSNMIILVFLLMYRRKFQDSVSYFGLHLVIGGALGNIYDRIAYKSVVDFVDLSFFPAVFNVADAAITFGAVMIVISMIKEKLKGAQYKA